MNSHNAVSLKADGALGLASREARYVSSGFIGR